LFPFVFLVKLKKKGQERILVRLIYIAAIHNALGHNKGINCWTFRAQQDFERVKKREQLGGSLFNFPCSTYFNLASCIRRVERIIRGRCPASLSALFISLQIYTHKGLRKLALGLCTWHGVWSECGALSCSYYDYAHCSKGTLSKRA